MVGPARIRTVGIQPTDRAVPLHSIATTGNDVITRVGWIKVRAARIPVTARSRTGGSEVRRAALLGRLERMNVVVCPLDLRPGGLGDLLPGSGELP